MIKFSYYSERTLTDEVWYESSNVFYSRFVEHSDDNNGELYVTFKNGSTYHYKDVDMIGDYMMFRSGGLDGSVGKALNSFIKGRYDFEKAQDEDINELSRKLESLIEASSKEDVFFISGHRDITQEEFSLYYEPLLEKHASNPSARFVVGDYEGVDIMAQDFLMDSINLDSERICVYHMSTSPRNINEKITHTSGGYESDEERDSAMTMASSYDIAFIRDGKVNSGTEQNVLRRHKMVKN